MQLRFGGRQQLSESACREEFRLICRAIYQFKAMANATMHVKSAFEQVKEQFFISNRSFGDRTGPDR